MTWEIKLLSLKLDGSQKSNTLDNKNKSFSNNVFGIYYCNNVGKGSVLDDKGDLNLVILKYRKIRGIILQ